MSWYAGDTHFLVSDHINHRASGAHAHAGPTNLNAPREQIQTQVHKEDVFLMDFVKEYLNKYI